ncbi:MAG: hypothetical protein AB1483_11725 [Candidatus Zixiibacteriota bacterium]
MEGATSCYICGHELNDAEDQQWVSLGEIEDKFSADFATETLGSYEIPVVIISRSGFFGNIGLPLNPFYKPGSALFEVMVPQEYIQEASDILDMTLGDKWQRKEK